MASTSNSSGRLAQAIVGLVVLVVLAGVAVGVYLKQFRYDRSIYAPAELTTPDAVTAASQFVYALPEALEPMTRAEQFTPATLYEKINGGAELFLEAGFVRLDCQRFQLIGQSDAWLELFAYDMGSPSNAFSVFSAQRTDGAEPFDVTRHAYRAGGTLLFCHGRTYMRIQPATQEANLLAAAEAMARSYVDLTVVAAEEGLDPASLFAAEGMVADSLNLRNKDVFGCGALSNVYLVTYAIDGVEATAFLSVRDSVEEADELAAAYRQFLEEIGAKELSADDRLDPPLLGMSAYGYNYVVLSVGPYLAGVHECSDLAVASKVAARLYRRLSEELE